MWSGSFELMNPKVEHNVHLFCQRYGTTGGIMHVGTHNRSENGSGRWVALRIHPTRTDTDQHPSNDSEAETFRRECGRMDKYLQRNFRLNHCALADLYVYGFTFARLLCSLFGYNNTFYYKGR
jgi:hypothetical protein